MHAPHSDTSLADLLVEWELLRQQGKPLSATELCARHQRLDLAEDLEREIEQQHVASRMLRPSEAGRLPPKNDRSPRESRAVAGNGPLSTTERYRVVRFHARGGLGEVHVAEDTELRRPVALKRIQERHADRPDSQQRFLREAEITGQLEHPGIVPVYGLVQGPDGQPCYAMRFIEGESLAGAIGRFHAAGAPRFDSLDFRQLLQRFIAVCNTIAYAHSRGVIHRDLKPDNIMLGKYGETLVVDWGLAKRCGEDDPDEPAPPQHSDISGASRPLTQPGGVYGTPAYMSPEQAAGKTEELGPGTDIYSLGATLLTLLTHQPPIRGRDVGEVLRRVQAGDLDWPAGRSLPAPLAAICKKALAQQPNQRSASPLELARDLEHWLADEPVSTWQEPWRIKVRRWARRHRTLVTASLAVLVVLTVSASIGSILLGSAYRQADFLNEQLTVANAGLTKSNADLTRSIQEEQRARQRVTQVLDRFVATFRLPSPEHEGEKLTVVDAMQWAAQELEADPAVDTFTRAALLRAIGQTYLGLGKTAEAIQTAEAARRLFEQELAPDDPELLATINNLAHCYEKAGRTREALPLLEQNLGRLQRQLGLTHPHTLAGMNNLAAIYSDGADLQKGLRLLKQVLELRKTHLGPHHPDTLSSMNNLGETLLSAGQYQDAANLLCETLRLRREHLGPAHLHTINTGNNLANAYQHLGQLEEALPLRMETQQWRTTKLGPQHPSTLTSMNNLAATYRAVRRLDEARDLFQKTYELRREVLGPTHPQTLITMNNLAQVYRETGRLDQALPLFQSAYDHRKSTQGRKHPHTLESMNSLAGALRQSGQLEEAASLYEEVLELRLELLGPNHPATLNSMSNLALAYQESGRWHDALQHGNKALELRRQHLGPTHPDTLLSSWNLGKLYLQPRLYSEAEPHLLLCATEAGKGRNDLPPRLQDSALLALIDLYDAWGRPQEAEKWREQLPALDRLLDGLERQQIWPLLWGWARF
jgi:serine/threonine protein kinase